METRFIEISLETAKRLYEQGGEYRNIALTAFKEHELIGDRLPKTWEEFCKQNKIKKKADGYGKLAPAFLEGAKFALENQWIGVEENLPCNNPNNIHFGFTNKVFVIDSNKNIFIAYMKKNKNNKWVWCSDDNFDLSHIITHWMPIPEPPKE